MADKTLTGTGDVTSTWNMKVASLLVGMLGCGQWGQTARTGGLAAGRGLLHKLGCNPGTSTFPTNSQGHLPSGFCQQPSCQSPGAGGGGYIGIRARHTASPHPCEPPCPPHKGRTALAWRCPAGYMGRGSLLCWEFFRSRMLPPTGGRRASGQDEAQEGTLSKDSVHRSPTQWASSILQPQAPGAPQGAVGVCCHLQAARGTASSCPAIGALPTFL